MNKIVLEMDEVIDKAVTQCSDLVRQPVKNNPTNQGAVAEDDTVSDYATLHKDAETTSVTSTSTINDGEWFFNGSLLACFFCQYQAAVQSLILKHGPLPPEDYCNEIVSLFNVVILDSGRHSDIVGKAFGGRLLNDLTAFLLVSSIDYYVVFEDSSGTIKYTQVYDKRDVLSILSV